MRDSTVARNYAETLFELARRNDALEEYQASIEEVAGLLEEIPDFRLFVETPTIEPGDKKEVLRRVFADRFPRAFLNFLLVTVDKRRQRLLGRMAREYRLLLDEHLGREHVEVVVARPMEEGYRERIADRLGRILGKEVIPHVRVRSSILGGVIVRSGQRIYDGSLRRRLEDLRRHLLGARIAQAQ